MASYTARGLRAVLASSWASLVQYFRYRASLVTWFLTLPMWVLFFAFIFVLFLPPELEEGMLRELAWSFVFFGLLSELMWSVGMSLRRMKEGGVLEAILATAGGLKPVVAGISAKAVVDSVIYGTYTLLLFRAVYGLELRIRNPIALLAALVLAFACCYALSAILASLTYGSRSLPALINLVQFPLLLLSGALIPPRMLPGWLRIAALASPLTYSLDLARNAATGCPTVLSSTLEWIVAGASTCLSLVLADLAIDRVERIEREGRGPSVL